MRAHANGRMVIRTRRVISYNVKRSKSPASVKLCVLQATGQQQIEFFAQDTSSSVYETAILFGSFMSARIVVQTWAARRRQRGKGSAVPTSVRDPRLRCRANRSMPAAHRVYPPVVADPNGSGAAHRDATAHAIALAEANGRPALVELEVVQVRARVEDLSRDRDEWRTQAQRLALTDQRARRSWWPWRAAA
jgi:hypothetical protein